MTDALDEVSQALTYLVQETISRVTDMDRLIATKAMERLVHIAIEAIADIGNLLIDALIMRDPASYADIIDILHDETVITTDVAEVLRPMVAFRRTLMQDYTSKHAASLFLYAQNAHYIQQFVEQVKNYLSAYPESV
ncbi:hypothetical protein BM613_02245 [Sulfoacidibacillus thermotolerans]|uniref:DUF86 domain-containing protein n=1 Tax=Sulfoacidibacillus thermotolerans TaxID=1765684 RepID=A0A2U3DCL3_SULT2|nr:hypothetical protein BM613_02245 [Sulfoacidibacillus thermotolerans]